MNFANLAGIYNKEFMERPIPKTLGISVYEMTIKGMILSKDLLKHETQYCVNYAVHQQRDFISKQSQFSSPVFTLSARNPWH